MYFKFFFLEIVSWSKRNPCTNVQKNIIFEIFVIFKNESFYCKILIFYLWNLFENEIFAMLRRGKTCTFFGIDLLKMYLIVFFVNCKKCSTVYISTLQHIQGACWLRGRVRNSLFLSSLFSLKIPQIKERMWGMGIALAAKRATRERIALVAL